MTSLTVVRPRFMNRGSQCYGGVCGSRERDELCASAFVCDVCTYAQESQHSACERVSFLLGSVLPVKGESADDWSHCLMAADS